MSSSANVARVWKLAIHSINSAFQRLEKHVTDTAKKTIVDTMKNHDVNQYQEHFRYKNHKSGHSLLAPILRYTTSVCIIFEATIVHTESTGNFSEK